MRIAGGCLLAVYALTARAAARRWLSVSSQRRRRCSFNAGGDGARLQLLVISLPSRSWRGACDDRAADYILTVLAKKRWRAKTKGYHRTAFTYAAGALAVAGSNSGWIKRTSRSLLLRMEGHL